jgi:hypothetical protein
VIAAWLKSGLLVEFEYDNEDSKSVWGVKIDDEVAAEVLSALGAKWNSSAITETQWRTRRTMAIRH